MLREMAKANRACAILPSETFPIWMDPKISSKRISKKGGDDVIYHDFEKDELFRSSAKYWNLVNPLKEKVDAIKSTIRKGGLKSGCIFALFAVQLDPKGTDTSGHYAAFFWEAKIDTVTVFDSMQYYDGGSSYTPFFRQLAVHIFGVKIQNANAPECFKEELSLQITGGFTAGEPLMIMKSQRPLDVEEKTLLHIQSTESQNHFCYMWSLWYLHHKMMGMDPIRSAEEIWRNKVDPLIVIKKYIWAVFHLQLEDRRLVDQIDRRYRKFFNKHFPGIWTNDIGRTLEINFDFQTYTIPMKTCKTINECLAESLRFSEVKGPFRTPVDKAQKMCF